MYISKNIKHLRKIKGLTQSDIAEKLDKTVTVVGGYERGKIIPPLEVAIQLCKIFGVNIDDLINKDLSKEEPGRTEQKEDPARLVAENDDLLMRFLILKLEEVSNRLKDTDPELYAELRLEDLIRREKKNFK